MGRGGWVLRLAATPLVRLFAGPLIWPGLVTHFDLQNKAEMTPGCGHLKGFGLPSGEGTTLGRFRPLMLGLG